jgi:hypothetical protein
MQRPDRLFGFLPVIDKTASSFSISPP